MEDGIAARDEVVDKIRVENRAKHEFKVGSSRKMFDVAVSSRRQIVQGQDAVASLEEAVGEVGADEAGTARDENVHPKIVGKRFEAPH